MEVKFIWDDIDDALRNKTIMDQLYIDHNVYKDSTMYLVSGNRILNIFIIKNNASTN